MEKYKEALHSDARQLTIYARTSPYISRAFYHIFGKSFWKKVVWTAATY